MVKYFLFILVFFFEYSHLFAQTDSALYLYFDKIDKSQTVKRNYRLFSPYTHTFYIGDHYYYNKDYYNVIPGEGISFITEPQKRVWTISLKGLQRYKPIDIATWVKQIEQYNAGDIYGRKAQVYVNKFKEFYIVEVDKTKDKAKITAVKLHYFVE